MPKIGDVLISINMSTLSQTLQCIYYLTKKRPRYISTSQFILNYTISLLPKNTEIFPLLKELNMSINVQH